MLTFLQLQCALLQPRRKKTGRNQGEEVRGPGARDADVFRAPGTFFLILFICYANVFTVTVYATATATKKRAEIRYRERETRAPGTLLFIFISSLFH
jgi:hypothetical protein